MHPKNDPNNEIFFHFSLVYDHFFAEDLDPTIRKKNLREFSTELQFGYTKMRLHQMFLKLFIHNTTSHLLCKDPSQTNAGQVAFFFLDESQVFHTLEQKMI